MIFTGWSLVDQVKGAVCVFHGCLMCKVVDQVRGTVYVFHWVEFDVQNGSPMNSQRKTDCRTKKGG